jgi:hypothetical protein
MVLIAVQSQVLAAGVESLLTSVAGLQACHADSDELPSLRAAIAAVQPRLLVLDAAQAPVQLLQALFDGAPGLKVLVVNADNNLVQLYERRELALQVDTDWLHVLQAL